MGAGEKAARVPGQDALAGRVESLPEEADLAAVGVAREDQIDPAVDEHGFLQAPVLRVVAEEDLVSLLALEAVQPFCPGPEDIGVGVPDLMRVGLPARVLFAEAPEVRQHAGREAADQYAAGPLADPAVVQDDSAGRGQALQVGGADAGELCRKMKRIRVMGQRAERGPAGPDESARYNNPPSLP